MLVSVLFPALLTVEDPRFQTVLAGHLDIIVFFLPYSSLDAGAPVSVMLPALRSEMSSDGKQLFVRRGY